MGNAIGNSAGADITEASVSSAIPTTQWEQYPKWAPPKWKATGR